MKLVLDKKHGNRVEFIVSDASTTFLNMLRRYSISRVPVMAIDSITFYDNTSAFWDEYLAHRIGLMPVTTPDKTPETAEVIFSVDAEGPKTVYSSDMESSDKGIGMAQEKIIVATLGPDQHLRLEGKAVLGIGKKHAKFQAGIIGYGEEEKGFRMFVESFYQMQPYEVLVRGCNEIESDIEEIEAALGKKKKKAAKKTAAKKKK